MDERSEFVQNWLNESGIVLTDEELDSLEAQLEKKTEQSQPSQEKQVPVQKSEPVRKQAPVGKPESGDKSKKVTRMKAEPSGDYSVIRNVPTMMVRLARREFPNAANNTDALVAYMVTRCPEMHDSTEVMRVLTDSQRDLIKDSDTGVFSEFSDRMLMVRKKLDALQANDSLFRTMLYLLVADRLNLMSDVRFRDAMLQKTDVFAENSELFDVAEFLDGLAKEFNRRRAIRDGRPYGF